MFESPFFRQSGKKGLKKYPRDADSPCNGPEGRRRNNMDVGSLQRTQSSIREMGDLLKSMSDARIQSDNKTLDYSVTTRVENAALGNILDLSA